MKRNRDAIAQMAIYDLLCRMQKNANARNCVIQLITDSFWTSFHHCEKYCGCDAIPREKWNELKETIIEMRDSGGTATQNDVCKFLTNLMEILEKG